MKTIITIHAMSIVLYVVGLAVIIAAYVVYKPPLALYLGCLWFYCWRFGKMFRFTSVQVER